MVGERRTVGVKRNVYFYRRVTGGQLPDDEAGWGRLAAEPGRDVTDRVAELVVERLEHLAVERLQVLLGEDLED
ncbi:hypothetical protein ARSEF4850_009316 [Beauveria asiatica]